MVSSGIRTYQINTVRKALAAVESGKRPLVVSPGGSGKTVMIAMIAYQYFMAGKRVLCFGHRREIVNHIYDHIVGLSVDESHLGVIMADDDRVNDDASIYVGNLMSILSRGVPDVDLIIVDEAHHSVADSWMAVIGDRREVIGFTATPYRMDGSGFDGIYDVLINSIMPSELIDLGWLAKPVIFSPGPDMLPDLKGLKKVAGEYSLSQLDGRVNNGELVGNIIEHWMRHARGRQTLVFATTVNHSQRIVERFAAAGIAAEHLDGEFSTDERNKVLERFRNKEVMVLSSCMLLSEGFDVPECGAGILARPTLSLTLSLQQQFRMMRPHGDNIPVILDHAGHYLTFGYPYSDRIWSLDGTADVKGDDGIVFSCPECGRVIPDTASVCECGGERPQRDVEREVPAETWYDLVDVSDINVAKEFRNRLMEMAKNREAPDGWVDKVFFAWIESNSFEEAIRAKEDEKTI